MPERLGGGMSLVSYLRRCGGYLALAALTLQIALSFGHVHPIGTLRTDVANIASVEGLWQVPSHLPADDADGPCAICASISLASTSFVPDAPQLRLPTLFERVQTSTETAFVLVFELQRGSFLSRAPPLA